MLSKSQVKYIQSLNQKKVREENGVFVAEGPKILNELLASKTVEPVAIFGNPGWWEKNSDIKNEIPFVAFHEITDGELERISLLSTPHQVLGIFKVPAFTRPVDASGAVVLMLDTIQDPGNLGTIVRIADWFGISQIIAGTETADVFNPKVVQSSMGSLARVQVVYADLVAFLHSHKQVPVYATTLNGKPVNECSKLNAGIVLIGNESKGIRPELMQLSTEKITIPRAGEAESLNAAVATGIILSHLV